MKRFEIFAPAYLSDFFGLAPGAAPWTPEGRATLKRQIAASQTFALARVGGKREIFCAGGFWANPHYPERMAWMFWTPRPPARAMVEGVREILRGLPPGPVINAYCDADDPARSRYLRAVGFVAAEGLGSLSSADLAAPMLPSRILRMEWR